MQKDLGKLEAESSATIKSLARIEIKLEKHGDMLKTIKITAFVIIAILSIVATSIKFLDKIPY